MKSHELNKMIDSLTIEDKIHIVNLAKTELENDMNNKIRNHFMCCELAESFFKYKNIILSHCEFDKYFSFNESLYTLTKEIFPIFMSFRINKSKSTVWFQTTPEGNAQRIKVYEKLIESLKSYTKILSDTPTVEKYKALPISKDY